MTAVLPNRIDRGGPPAPIAENFIPAIYNSQSTLELRIADLPDKKKVGFQLNKTPAAGCHGPRIPPVCPTIFTSIEWERLNEHTRFLVHHTAGAYLVGDERRFAGPRIKQQ